MNLPGARPGHPACKDLGNDKAFNAVSGASFIVRQFLFDPPFEDRVLNVCALEPICCQFVFGVRRKIISPVNNRIFWIVAICSWLPFSPATHLNPLSSTTHIAVDHTARQGKLFAISKSS